MAATTLEVEDLIADEEMVVTFTHAGYVKRLPATTYRTQGRGGKGIAGVNLKDNDFVEELFVASTHDYILFFTNFGKVYRCKVHELPVGSRTSRGKALVNVLEMAEGEHPASILATKDFPEDEFVMFATKEGVVKKTALSAYNRTRKDGMIAIKLKDGDELVNVRRVKPGERVVMTSSDGKTIVFDEGTVRPMGRNTSGVRGMKLKKDARMLGMEISSGQGDLFVVTEKGYGKRTAMSEYTMHNRGGQGITTINMTAKKGDLVAVKVLNETDELMLMSQEGTVIRVKAQDISRLGRATQGVKVMNVSDEDRVTSAARMTPDDAKDDAKTAASAQQELTLDDKKD